MNNPFLEGFTIVRLLAYITTINLALNAKKSSMTNKKRMKFRDDLFEAQKVLKQKVDALSQSKDPESWRVEAGVPVKIAGTKTVGIVQPGIVPHEPKMLIVTSPIPDSFGTLIGNYYIEELTIVLPHGIFNVPS